jgi:hypothetical protein
LNLVNHAVIFLKIMFQKMYGIGNPGPDLGQAQKCCGVKLINGILTLFVWYYSMKE